MLEITIDPQYDFYREMIKRRRKLGEAWESILRFGTDEKLRKLEEEFFLPKLTHDEWRRIAEMVKLAEERALQATILATKSADDAILGNENNADIAVAESSASCWQRYRAQLEKNGWHPQSIDSVKEIAHKTLKRMRRNTLGMDPVRGLVVGHVQSGKTANMAALMAIGADNGYNFFIVLSGCIENLRLQTQNRLINDLNGHIESGQNLTWHSLHHLGASNEHGQRLQDRRFDGSDRHMTVSLKNPNRLGKLLKWLKACPDKLNQMKIVIIDDEADQAGINTADVNNGERTRINNLIVQLTQIKALAVNYVSYTATPYANFLNEAYPDSLYPRDFIVTLPQPDEHFGPQQIFGLEGRYTADSKPSDGLDIIREIETNELDLIKGIHQNKDAPLPESLKNALCWFLCASATRRHWSINVPSSMLIHTSQMCRHHESMAIAIKEWLGVKDDVEKYCRSIWQTECTRFTDQDFWEQFPGYGEIAKIYGKPPALKKYPEFDDINTDILRMLEQITAVQLDKDQQPIFHEGLHLCVDNSANNFIDNENQIRRLIYPQFPLAHPTAFIVIGGSTLSRGLTIEGLVSTYFLRNSNQMDTLMQMGRWFGYRKGYELLPRIWMTNNCRDKFTYLALVEKELREELRRYMEPPEIDPEEFGPRVANHYALNWMRPTARNRMQHAQETDFDFSSANSQTTLFLTEPEILSKNLKFTENLFEKLGEPSKASSTTALVWKKVKFNRIKPFLTAMHFHPNAKLFGEMPAFIEWYEKVQQNDPYDDWSVVAAGINDGPNGSWNINGHTLQKISRSRMKRSSNDGSISIGVLRTPKDLLADLDIRKNGIDANIDNNAVLKLRQENGLGNTPQMLIYRIDKGSKAESGSKIREDLGTSHDLIGVSFWLPGGRNADGTIKRYAKSLQIIIPAIPSNDGNDIKP